MMLSQVSIPLFGTNELANLDPAYITDSTQANFLRSIYATLLYFDPKGNLTFGAASDFKVSDNRIQFFIRNSLKTRDGDQIGAEDVYLSFKRQLILQKNTHGNLTNFIDCQLMLQKICDKCSGLHFDENLFEVTLKSKNHVPFFLSMVTTPDFSILPKKSVDYADPKMKILNLQNTSGAYYVENQTAEYALFKQNPSSYLIDERNPLEIKVTFCVGEDRDTRFENGDFDVIPTFGIFTQKNIKQFKNISNFNIYQTNPIQLTYIDFKKTGSNPLTTQERLSAGIALKNAYLSEFKEQYGMLETDQYFLPTGNAKLTGEQSIKITELFKNAKPLNRKVSADIAVMRPQKAKPVVDSLVNFEYQELYSIDDMQTEKSPDLYISMSDTGGPDDLSLLSYTQFKQQFGMSDIEFARWLDDYIDTESESLRFEKFRDLHFKMLLEVQVMPVGTECYYGIARKPWKIEANQKLPGSAFWTIKREK